MKRLFQTLLSALDNGRDAVLCSILASSGSAPRGAGSKLLVLDDGKTLGTIGGGAVELNAMKQATELFDTHASHVKGFRLSRNDVEDIGMICGGDVTVYSQGLSHDDEAAKATLRRVAELIDGDRDAWMISRIQQGAMTRLGVYDAEGGLRGLDGLSPDALQPLLLSRAVYRRGEPGYYAEPIARAGRVYVFGGGHVGRALVPELARLGFRVTVFDNRERVAEQFPSAQRFILGDYARIGEKLTLTADDYVVIMTPGHQADYEVLRQALRSPATYVGCIGSRHKVAATKARLFEDGFSDEDAARIHSPIGLDIGAETPEEIAVSVAAELIAHRAGRR